MSFRNIRGKWSLPSFEYNRAVFHAQGEVWNLLNSAEEIGIPFDVGLAIRNKNSPLFSIPIHEPSRHWLERFVALGGDLNQTEDGMNSLVFLLFRTQEAYNKDERVFDHVKNLVELGADPTLKVSVRNQQGVKTQDRSASQWASLLGYTQVTEWLLVQEEEKRLSRMLEAHRQSQDAPSVSMAKKRL